MTDSYDAHVEYDCDDSLDDFKGPSAQAIEKSGQDWDAMEPQIRIAIYATNQGREDAHKDHGLAKTDPKFDDVDTRVKDGIKRYGLLDGLATAYERKYRTVRARLATER